MSSRQLNGQFGSQMRTGNTDLGVVSIGLYGRQALRVTHIGEETESSDTCGPVIFMSG